uniref:Ig-like domain-containing protein n=1 Tax=Tetranychus urticae TaxID=32264 RepID=T1JPL2_TETUR
MKFISQSFSIPFIDHRTKLFLFSSLLPSESHLFSYKRIFGATTKIEPPSRPLSSWDDPTFKPYFDDNNVDNVTTQLGKTAHLHCKIRQLGDRTVRTIIHFHLNNCHKIYDQFCASFLISTFAFQLNIIGRYTYTSDQRFTCIHLDDSDDWTLEIKYVQKDDAGIYECQVSTEPKMSLSIKLGVVAAKAIIPEGPELFVEVGVTVNLTCLISEPSSSPPVYVFWYHDGTVINYDSPRGGDIKVTTDRSSSAVSRLTIIESRPSDSGEYSCKPSYADFANATLHVVAASSSSPSSSLSSIALDKKDFPGELTPFYQYPASLGTSLFQYHHQYYINWSIYFFGWLVIYRSK